MTQALGNLIAIPNLNIANSVRPNSWDFSENLKRP
jgi:hypothetical protein